MNVAVIVAAGKGTRMGPDVDKIFLELAGDSVAAHTWRRFEESPRIDHIVLVVREGMQSAFEEIARSCNFKKSFSIVAGGNERQDSVWNGLEAVPAATKIVAIQDAARPCTTPSLIAATIDAAERTGASVAAQRVTDTIKESSDGKLIAGTVDRSRLWSVQTPQTFRIDVIRRALLEVKKKGLLITDDTAACEMIGQAVELVVSSDPNPKVTQPGDLPYVESVLRHMSGK
jgi:2-C-methyl-D-erythritol 4-phosphate cytidylyltransferase